MKLAYSWIALLLASTLPGGAQILRWSFDAAPQASGVEIGSVQTLDFQLLEGFSGRGGRPKGRGCYRVRLSRPCGGDGVSISAFVRVSGYPEGLGNQILSAADSSRPGRIVYALRMQDSLLQFVVADTSPDGKPRYRSVTSSRPVPLGRWIHVCAVRDQVGIHLYINGALDKTLRLSGHTAPADLFMVGSETDLRSRLFNGALDEVAVRFAPLGEREIAEQYSQLAGLPSPVRSGDGIYYPVDIPPSPPGFPGAPARLRANLRFLRLRTGEAVRPENLRLVAWDKAQNRPLPDMPIPQRLSFDLRDGEATIFCRPPSGVSSYALVSLPAEKASSGKIPLIGAGEPVSAGRMDLGAELGQGLASYPCAVDFDLDGDLDLLVSYVIPRRIFLYENVGTDSNGNPVLKAPRMVLDGKSLLNFDLFQEKSGTIWAYAGRKGKLPGSKKNTFLLDQWCYDPAATNAMGKIQSIPLRGLPADGHIFDVSFRDADGDGTRDLLLGVWEGNWWWPDGIDPWEGENPKVGYGKGYDSRNKWLGSAPVGSVYFAKNSGTDTRPRFERLQILTADGKPIRMPTNQMTPCLVDLDRNGTLDLLLAVGIDRMLAFYNRAAPGEAFDFARPVNALRDTPVSKWSYFDCRFEVCDWDGDGRDEILVGSNPGVVVKCEVSDGKIVEDKILECRGGNVWADTLVVPSIVDFNRDGTWDIVMGDASGYLNFFPNTGSNTEPLFKKRERLKSGCAVFHPVAGYSGSIQGPEEARWGYLAPNVCDWNGDGKYDVVASDITGYVYWLPNFARSAKGCDLSRPVPLAIDGWPLKTRWRTRPCIFPGEDGNPCIVTSDPEGFLAIYRRDWIQGPSALKPGERLRFSDGRDIKIDGLSGYNGRNKLCATDWNGDGKLDLLVGQNRRSGIGAHVRFDLPRSRRATLVLLLNVGSNSHPVFSAPRQLLLADGSPLEFGAHSCSPAMFDYDGDGHDDLFVGTETGFVRCFNRSMFESGARIAEVPAFPDKRRSAASRHNQ